jgi:hypothetical protein
MIGQIMDSIRNHFARYKETRVFQVVSDGIVGSFSNTYIPGQYIWIKNSIINDGVYKVVTATSSKITVEEVLLPEDTHQSFDVYGLGVPRDFLALVADIEEWQTKNGGSEGIASEGIDDYSVAFAKGGESSTWKVAFQSRLSTYQKAYDCDKRRKFRY